MQISGFILKNWHSIHVVHFSRYLHLFPWASFSLKSCFVKKACECQCLSSLSVNNILYFSLLFLFSLPSLKEKELSFWFCTKVLWSSCLCWYCSQSDTYHLRPLAFRRSLSLSSHIASRLSYGWGRAERCFWNSRDSIHTFIRGKFWVKAVQWAYVMRLSVIMSIAVSLKLVHLLHLVLSLELAITFYNEGCCVEWI